MKTVISRDAALEFIRETADAGRMFGVRFRKRTTGEMRRMTAKLGVKAHLVPNPSKPGVNFKAHNLLGVYDMDLARLLPLDERNRAYRSIPIDGIVELEINGEWVDVTD